MSWSVYSNVSLKLRKLTISKPKKYHKETMLLMAILFWSKMICLIYSILCILATLQGTCGPDLTLYCKTGLFGLNQNSVLQTFFCNSNLATVVLILGLLYFMVGWAVQSWKITVAISWCYKSISLTLLFVGSFQVLNIYILLEFCTETLNLEIC